MKSKQIGLLVLNLVESIAALYEDEDNKEIGVDFDIDSAISLKNYDIQGLADFSKKSPNSRYEKHPPRANIEYFAINLYQKTDKFLNLLISFDYAGYCYCSLFYSDKKVENPYKNRGGEDIDGKDLVFISDELRNKIVKNLKLQKIIEDYVRSNLEEDDHDNEPSYIKDATKKYLKALSQIDIERNNYSIEKHKEHVKRKAERDKVKDEIRNYANKRQKELNRKYRYTKYYYEFRKYGPREPIRRGSGEVSLGEIAVQWDILSTKGVDELIDELHEKSVTFKQGDFHTIYSEIK